MFYKGNSQQIQRLMRMGAGCARENPLEQIFSTEAGEEKRAFRVSGSSRAKTYGSAVHTIFQIFGGSRICSGLWLLRGGSTPRDDRNARQLSRKGWLYERA